MKLSLRRGFRGYGGVVQEDIWSGPYFELKVVVNKVHFGRQSFLGAGFYDLGYIGLLRDLLGA